MFINYKDVHYWVDILSRNDIVKVVKFSVYLPVSISGSQDTFYPCGAYVFHSFYITYTMKSTDALSKREDRQNERSEGIVCKAVFGHFIQ